jgi:hypothetical protein
MVECLDYSREGLQECDRQNKVIRFKNVGGRELVLPGTSLDTILLVFIRDKGGEPLSEIVYPFFHGQVAEEKRRLFLQDLHACICDEVEKRTDVYNLQLQKYAVGGGKIELQGVIPVKTKEFVRILDIFSR